MKNLACIAVALLAAACASTQDLEPDLPRPAPQAAPDPRVGELQTQLTELLERIDVLNHRIAQLENVGTGFSPSTAPAAAVVPAPQSATRPAATRTAETAVPPRQQPPSQAQRAIVGADIAESYRQAITQFGRGRHTDARRGFEEVYEADPSGDLADNALFWIGETYFAAKDYTNAVRFYNRVVNDYSTQNKAPDALFKVAMTQERTGDLALARRTLQQVIERYPYSSTASTAKAELERIRY